MRLKKVALRECTDCGFPVSGGGNRHAVGHCVPGERHGERWRRRKSQDKARRQHQADMAGVVRGVSVAGTGKPSASSGEKAGVKKTVEVRKEA